MRWSNPPTIKVKLSGHSGRQGWLDANKNDHPQRWRVVNGCNDVELAMHPKCTAFREMHPIPGTSEEFSVPQVIEV
jgi:hypothetical protein